MKSTVSDVLQKHHPIAINVISQCPKCRESFKSLIKEKVWAANPEPTEPVHQTSKSGAKNVSTG